MQWTDKGGEMLEFSGAHLYEGNLEAYMRGPKNKEHNLSDNDKESMISRTRKFLLVIGWLGWASINGQDAW